MDHQLTKTIHVKPHIRNFSSDHHHQSPTSVLPTSRKSNQSNGLRKTLTLTDLELEELKGFKDLGFKFSDEDRNDPNLVSIVPGLRKQPRINKDIVIQRPYLSEAWEAVMKKNEAVGNMTLAINYSDHQNEMKEQIKLWARSVAAAIR